MEKMPFILGVAGGTGSGKSTAAHFIAGKLSKVQTSIISFDDYYKDLPGTTIDERAKINYDHPDSLEYELLAQHISQMRKGKAVQKPTYNFATHSRMTEYVRLEPTSVIIIEGILSLYFEEIREQFDLRLFIDTPADIRFIRRLKRDTRERGRSMESVIDQYLATVRPMHELYVEPTKQYADKIISGMNGWEELNKVIINIPH